MVNGREMNFILLLAVCDNDIFKALEIARKHNGLKITMAAKTVERILMELLMNLGWSDDRIVESMFDKLGKEEKKTARRRVTLLRHRLERRHLDGQR